MEYVKICGLKNIEDIKLCNNKIVTAIGFIYNVPESPRNLNKVEINQLLKKIPRGIRTVLVFKPKSLSEVLEIIENIETDLYQVHCNFNIRSLERLSSDIKEKLIVALKVNSKNKSSIIKEINLTFNQFFAYVLDGSEGQGIEFDYDLILEVLKKTNGINIILAGGISLDNLEKIIKNLNPFGIDISSALESERGIKDPQKIKKFLYKLDEIKQEIVV
ncbi:MAG: phosphoribosylanthranilate isomerase [Promethearchaeota archaeon]|nr:MAG: phosphoribosylanthranilate isomerase [Candidatus Lokiarchaeota archaeon]